MGFPITALVASPAFLARSLKAVIGPRWAFRCLYCRHQSAGKITNLSDTNLVYVSKLDSETLDAECASQGLTRLQLYEAWVPVWQLGAGQRWCRQREENAPMDTAMGAAHGDESSGDESSGNGLPGDDLHADDASETD